ncbi:MAG: hypothetical protein Q9221_001094 [Calogaya cf. arnoldii]
MDISVDNSLTVEDENFLLEDRIVIEKSSNGKRKVSAALLTPPASQSGSLSSNSSSSTASSATASVRFAPIVTVNSSFVLPDHHESVAAVEFCGFTLQAAQETYSRFANSRKDPDNPDDLLDFMKAQTLRAKKEEIPPREAMTMMGITTSIQDRILNGRFENIRLTQPIVFWVQNTIEINYKTLLVLQKRLKTAANFTHAKKKKKRESLQAATFQPGAKDEAPTGTATVSRPGVSAFQNLPEAHVTVAEARPKDKADFYTLFKGKAAAEMGDWIGADVAISLDGLRTYSGGDFNVSEAAYYWTLEHGTAEEYCNYAGERCSYSEIWLISVQLRKTYVDSLRTKSLWYGHDWKEFVWCCRKTRIPPPRYDDFYKGDEKAQLIKGHVCKNGSNLIMNIKAEDVQTRITPDNVMTIPGSDIKSTQWYFIGLETMAQFDEEAKGRFHIDIRPPPDSRAPTDPSSSKS